MDVRLPDGTVIKGVPDGMSKADLTAKLKLNGYDVSKLEQPAALTVAPEQPKQDQSNPLVKFLEGGRNLGAGLIAGAAGIGASINRARGMMGLPFGDTASESADRRASFEPALRNLTGADTDSFAYGGGKLGAEVMGTAGLGGALAKPIAYAASKIPAIAGAAAPIINSLQSSGFSSGLIPKVVAGAPRVAVPMSVKLADAGARVLGGAATGAATMAATEGDNAGTGAAVGAGVSMVAPPLVKALGKSAGFFADMFGGKLAAVQAGKITRAAAGERIGAIRAALTAAPDDLTAAQAAYGVQRNAFQALGALIDRTDDAAMILKRQASDEIAELHRLAGGGNDTEARSAYEASIRVLNKLTEDMRNVPLQAANQANETLNKLVPKLAQREASMVNALRQGMPANLPSGAAGTAEPGVSGIHAGTEALQRANVADDAARRLMVQRSQGARGMLSESTTPGANDRRIESAHRFVSEQWKEASDVFASIAKQRRAEAGFIERQIGSLKDNGLGPLSGESIVSAIDTKLAAPGTRASSNMVKVLGAVRDDIMNLTRQNGGVIDAHDLYTLRKEGINERIMQIMGQTDPKISSKVTRAALQELRPLLDDAIEVAGGGDGSWTKYLKTYSQGMRNIDQKAMAAKAAKLFKDSPEEYVRLVRGNNPDAVESIFGPGNYDIFKEMGSKMPTLEKLATSIERKSSMAADASKGVEELGRLVRDNTLSGRLPNTLSRKITAINASLDAIEKSVNKRTFEVLRKGMLSGKSAVEMMDTLPLAERNSVLRALSNPASWGKTGVVAANTSLNALAPSETRIELNNMASNRK